MTIHFYLRYHTEFGQDLFISGNNDFLGNNNPAQAIELNYFNDDFWHLKIELPQNFDDIVLYKYFLKDKDGSEIFDGEENRAIDLSVGHPQTITVFDMWNAASDTGNIFFSRPFGRVLLPGVTKVKPDFPAGFTHEFRVKAPLLQPGETICMCGSTVNLKSWSTTDPILFTPKNNWFVGRVQMKANEWPASYKYGIYNIDQKKRLRFEDGENRILQKNENESSLTIIHDGFVQFVDNGRGHACRRHDAPKGLADVELGQVPHEFMPKKTATRTGLTSDRRLPIVDLACVFQEMCASKQAASGLREKRHAHLHQEYPAARRRAVSVHPRDRRFVVLVSREQHTRSPDSASATERPVPRGSALRLQRRPCRRLRRQGPICR